MKNLEIKWSVSRARDTYGYNICTLIDGVAKYRTCGGGYDMIGTVFANWLAANYLDKIKERVRPYDYYVDDKDKTDDMFYGFFKKGEEFWLDGGCGLSSIFKIARETGLIVKTFCNRKGETTNIITMMKDNIKQEED